ncbi:MAG: hypothetical protein AB7W16_05525 [Candidatus Obscuribacterales bacterium]
MANEPDPSVQTQDLEPYDRTAMCLLRRYQAGDNVLDWMREISKDDAAPGFLLSRLANSSDIELKLAIADHSNTPLPILQMLANDDNPDIRFAVSENHNITTQILHKLAEDINPYVAFRAQKTLDRIATENSAREKVNCG